MLAGVECQHDYSHTNVRRTLGLILMSTSTSAETIKLATPKVNVCGSSGLVGVVGAWLMGGSNGAGVMIVGSSLGVGLGLATGTKTKTSQPVR